MQKGVVEICVVKDGLHMMQYKIITVKYEPTRCTIFY